MRRASSRVVESGKLGVGCAIAGGLTLAALAAFVAGYLLLPHHSAASDHAYGEAVGRMFVPTLGVAVASGIAWARGLRVLGGFLALASVGIIAAIVGAAMLGGGAPRPLDDAQRATPVTTDVNGTSMWVQAADGLAIPARADLTYVPDDAVLASLIARDPEQAIHLAGWRWTGPEGVPMVMAIVDVERAMSSERRSAFFRGVMEGARGSELPEGLTPFVDETLGPFDHVLRSSATSGSGGMLIHVFGYEHDGDFVVATVTVAGPDLASIEPIARGARPN